MDAEVGIMSESSIHVRIDREDKERFEMVCRQLGLSMSAAVNLFAKAVIRQGEIPFPQANEETLEALEQVNSRRGLSGPYRTIEELREALDA